MRAGHAGRRAVPGFPPGPASSRWWLCGRPASVGDETGVDTVGDLALEGADGFLGGLSLGDLAVVVSATLGVVSELGDRRDVQGVVDLAIPARVQPVPAGSPRGSLD